MINTRILIIEKEYTEFEHIIQQLSSFGYSRNDFFYTPDFNQLDNTDIHKFSPDVIIATIPYQESDLFLQVYLQLQEKFESVPVIIFSDVNDDKLAIKCVQAGAQSFLSKGSFDDQQLNRLVVYSRERNQFKLELERLKKDYQNIFEKNSVPMLIADKDTLQIISVNEAATALYKYTAEEFCRLTLKNLSNGSNVPDRFLPSEILLEDPQFACHYKKNGELMYVEMKESPIFYNKTSSLLVAVNDETARILSATEVLKARQRLDAIFNGTYDIILLVNDSGQFVQVNKTACLSLGYTNEEMLSLFVNDVALPKQEGAKLADISTDSFPYLDVQSGIAELKKRDGSRLICTYNTTADILPGLHLCIFTDVTSQEKNQKKIKEQSKKIENILNSISECFFTADKEWTITYWNKAAEKIIGVKKNEVIGQNLWDYFAGTKDLLFYTNCKKAIDENTPVHFEEYYPPSSMWFRVSCYPTKEGIAVFFSDTTEAKKHALEIQEIRNNQLALINSSVHLIWAVDKDMKLLSFNDAYAERIEKTTGAPASEGLQMPAAFHSADKKAAWTNYYQRALKGEAYTIIECIEDAKTNDKKMAEITFNPFYEINSGNIKGVACYSHDITQREEATRFIEKQNKRLKDNEQNLEKVTNKLEKIMNSSLDVICSIDNTGCFLQVSKASRYVWGYEPEEMTGKPVLHFVAPFSLNATRQAASNIFSGAIYTDFQNVFVHKSGYNVPLIWSARWDKDEQIMFCVARDASAMKEAEKLKAETEQRITAMIQKGADIIGIIDESANYLYISPNVKALLGYDPESLLNTNAIDFIHPDDAATALYDLKKVLIKGEVKLAAFRYKNAYGEWRWMETVATNQLNNPAIRGIVISSRDITKRKQIEDEREQMIKELLKSNADLKQFSFITSHNLRAPLSNIVGILNIIEYEGLDEYNRNMLHLLDKSVRQLGQTIDDLSKILILKNNVNVEIANIDLKETFTQVNSVFVNTLNDVCAHVVTDFKVKKIQFNPTYFESILVNLISNSIKYRSPNRSLTIHISSEADSNGNVILKFADNGIGIDIHRHKNKLFGLYQRFHDHTEGHGLGLFIIKSQIVALGGKIDIQSEVDEGTAFSITFAKASVKKASVAENYKSSV